MPFRWAYGEDNGPDHWHKDFPLAIEGVRQSPVAIRSDESEQDGSLMEIRLKWHYSPEKVLHIENTGNNWTVQVSGSDSCLEGGPLHGQYELWQFHAHWGSANDKGSEHTLDGRSFAAELHLVHWNRSKYRSVTDAISKPDGLAVLGVFIEVCDEPHGEFAKICKLMDRIEFKDQKAAFNEPVDIDQFLPKEEDDCTFFTYEGSLTTPPLLESVTWIVFRKTLKISQEQLDAMRSLMCCSIETHESDGGGKLVDNYRPPCPLGSRRIRRCQ